MTEKTPDVPGRPSLDGLEDRWAPRWDAGGIYRFRRRAGRDSPGGRSEVFSIDTPPPTVSGSLHLGSVFSYTHTDLIARFQRIRGRRRVHPVGLEAQRPPPDRRSPH